VFFSLPGKTSRRFAKYYAVITGLVPVLPD
jgi:hypothetical protein